MYADKRHPAHRWIAWQIPSPATVEVAHQRTGRDDFALASPARGQIVSVREQMTLSARGS
ncbi:hypothetical protein GCM10010156_73410 [Planobispora rosea]|uniref:Uncharacterized protein n=1 Tax=Planobispora rosea TaxID=35762 RepID=A0A8J3WGW9_PLARO|nr:hypothetical protein GCM10010156_73410 [Planobispora rosea]GIH88848.1 hypothetical protein Pro02_72560 [Planobispora rosea]